MAKKATMIGGHFWFQACSSMLVCIGASMPCPFCVFFTKFHIRREPVALLQLAGELAGWPKSGGLNSGLVGYGHPLQGKRPDFGSQIFQVHPDQCRSSWFALAAIVNIDLNTSTFKRTLEKITLEMVVKHPSQPYPKNPGDRILF